MGKIISTPLPKDLPENWNDNQYVSPGGTEVGLSEQHGYNYLMKQVNNAQKAIEELDTNVIPASEKGAANGIATLDVNGKLAQSLDVADVPMEGYGSVADAINKAIDTADAAKAVTDTKGLANGLATLDSDAKVTAHQASAAIVNVTESRALAVADAGRLLCVDSASAVVLTVPLETDVAFPVGTELEVCQLGAGAVSFAAADGVTLLSAGGAVMVAEQYGCVTLKKLGADKWMLAGMLG